MRTLPTRPPGRRAQTAGARAAFTIAAMASLPLILGAFFARKPADQPFPAPIAH